LLRHFWTLVPGGLLGAIELVQRATGETVEVPPWLFWLVLGAGLLFAAFLAFHDLRKSADAASIDVRRRVADEIGQIINEGGEMAGDTWSGIAFSDEEAWRFATDWWNGAGVFIETVLGSGERHIISESVSAPSREELLEAHCNLLRGVLQRLPSADIRVGEAGLDEAISARQPTAYK
jgi:hypothetical protein